MVRSVSQPMSLVLLVLVIGCLSSSVASESTTRTLRFERASFKATYIRGDEKVQRVRLSTDSETVKEIGIEEMVLSGDDSIVAQGSIINQKGEPASISQFFLRFLNKKTKEDNIYALRKKGRDMKLDFNLRKEIRKDLGFWQHDASYRVEMIYGDLKLDESGIWVVTDEMKFMEESKDLFREEERRVFDFDVGVKWSPQPEFKAAVPEKEKRAGTGMIVAALVGVTVPFFVLVGTWANMGVLNLRLPAKGKMNAIGLEALVLFHAIALGMFWWQWNIVTTWKFMGILMVPTLVFARGYLRDEESKGDTGSKR